MKRNKNKTKYGILILMVIFSFGFLVSCSTLGGFFGRLFSNGTEPPMSKDGDLKEFFANVRPGPGNPEAYYQLGKHYQERNLHHEAIKEFKKVVYINPQHAKALNRLGISFDLLGKYEQAIEAYREALKIDPRQDHVYNNLGYSCLLRGDVEKAVEAFKSAVALNGEKELYHNNLGSAYSRSNQYDLALQEFKTGGDEAEAYYNLANQYFEQGLYEEAKENYRAALDLKSTMVTARKRLEASEALARISNTENREGTRSSAEIKDSKELNKIAKEMARDGKENDKYHKEMRAGEVEISNGNGVNKMARVIGGFLTDNKFKVVRYTNADNFNYEESQIFYRKGYQNTAEQINQEFPVALNQKEVKNFDRPHIKVKLLVGRDVIPYKKNFARNQSS